MTTRQLLRWLALIWLLNLAWAGQATACPNHLAFTYASGERACLADFALVDEPVPGWHGNVRTLAPAAGNFNLAISPRGNHCPAVLGLALTTMNAAQLALAPSVEDRSMQALGECRRALAAQGPRAPACDCRIVLQDGQSPLSQQEFAVFATGRALPATASAPPRPAEANGASADELTALRLQLSSLRQELQRQQTPPAGQEPALDSPRGRARALVIGNGAYADLGRLPNPANDARAIATLLQRFGIDVDLVLDASRTALVRALTDYQAKAADYDVNILFYAGHGLQVDGVNYVVPVDMPARGVTAGSVKLNTVSLNDALEYLPATTRVVFLDACRDNPLSRSLRSTRSGLSPGLAPVDVMSGTLVAFATKDGATADDGQGRHSPYTRALLDHLEAEDDIAIVLRRVRQAVLKATEQRQEPWEYGSLVGDRLVLSRLRGAAAPR